jgi:hypothetical protein
VSPLAAAAVTVALLAANAFFVGAEFALVAARRSAVELHAEHGSRRAGATLRAMRRLSLMLAGAQLGVTVCSLALGAVSEPALAHLLEPVFRALGLPEGATHPAAFVIALAVITGLHVVLGEMVPKNATLAAPDTAALWLAPPLAAVVQALRPLIAALNGATNLALRAVRVQPRDEVATAITHDQLAGAIGQSHREGLLETDEHELLANAISFETATAADLTLPLHRVHTVAPRASAQAVERLAAATGVSRFPVRDGARLLGYLHIRDIPHPTGVGGPVLRRRRAARARTSDRGAVAAACRAGPGRSLQPRIRNDRDDRPAHRRRSARAAVHHHGRRGACGPGDAGAAVPDGPGAPHTPSVSPGARRSGTRVRFAGTRSAARHARAAARRAPADDPGRRRSRDGRDARRPPERHGRRHPVAAIPAAAPGTRSVRPRRTVPRRGCGRGVAPRGRAGSDSAPVTGRRLRRRWGAFAALCRSRRICARRVATPPVSVAARRRGRR